jgi:hypothetical protein
VSEPCWVVDPSPKHVAVLVRIRDGRQRYNRDLFEVAHLIANGWASADPASRTLSITDDGRGELALWSAEVAPA